MNKVYKIVWHTSKRQWVVVSELAKKGKTKSIKLLAVTALATLSANTMASPCTASDPTKINISGSSCELNEDSYTGTETKGKDNKVISVDNGGKVTFKPTSGKVTITSQNQNHALVIGTAEPYPGQSPVNNRPSSGGVITVDGDLSINVSAKTMPPDETKKQYRPSSILIGDNSELIVNGKLNINHSNHWADKNDQNQAEYGTGAPIDVSLANAHSAKIIVKDETNIKSDGDGIRNGSEQNNTQFGGDLNFKKDVEIEANYIGLKNSAGNIIFDENLNISIERGKAIVQTSGLIHAKGDLNLKSSILEGNYNSMDIYGGEIKIDGTTNIDSHGSGDQWYASGTSLYVSGNSKVTFGSELNATTHGEGKPEHKNAGIGDVIKIQNEGEVSLATKTLFNAEGSGNGINMSQKSKLNLNQETIINTKEGDGINIDGGTISSDKANLLAITTNGKGNAINMRDGIVNLAANTTLTTNDTGHGIKISNGTLNLNKQTTIHANDGNGIHVEGGNIIAAEDSQLDIIASEAKAIYLSDGTLMLKDTNITKNNAGTAIELAGGTLSNLGKLTFEKADDKAALHSTVQLGQIATFNNSGSLDISKVNNIEAIIQHDGTGTLQINNTKNGILASDSGNIFTNTSTGTIVANNAGILSGKIETSDGIINLNNTGVWETTEHSKLTNVTNSGTIHFKHLPSLVRNTSEFFTIDITGDYVGQNGVVKMHTVWNAPSGESEANSESDVLNIAGTAKGITTIIPVSNDGTEKIIDGDVQEVEKLINTIPVVNVANSGAEVAFIGTAQTTGATEVQLAKRTVDNHDEYFWTTQIKSDTGNVAAMNAKSNIAIYADAVAGYTLMPSVNFEQGFSSLANLRERRGDIYCLNCATDNNQNTWARIFGKHQKQDGKTRLNLNTNIYGLQIGHDFLVTPTGNNGLSLLGGYISYTRANTDFSDRYHARNAIVIGNKKTGKGESDSFSLGITNTYYSGTGTYIDLVGQLSYLRNKYNAQTGKNPSTQDGWGVALSAETGHSIPLNDTNWSIEPQAQLIYQMVKLNKFTDRVRHVDQNNQDTLRGRVSLMLSYNELDKEGQNTSVYAIGNIWHDFLNPDEVKIGRDKISEKFNKTWGEIGLGLNIPVTNQSELYSDIRYEHNFSGSKRQSFRGNIGLKINW